MERHNYLSQTKRRCVPTHHRNRTTPHHTTAQHSTLPSTHFTALRSCRHVLLVNRSRRPEAGAHFDSRSSPRVHLEPHQQLHYWMGCSGCDGRSGCAGGAVTSCSDHKLRNPNKSSKFARRAAAYACSSEPIISDGAAGHSV